MRQPWQIWRDRRGRLSLLRIGALALLLLPVGIATYDWETIGFGARPLNDVIHRTGYWALIFVLVSLAVTPLRRIMRYGTLIDVRRMIGVGAFAYAFTHICLYVADQSYDFLKVATEIVLRLYLTIGFIALIGLTVLAATSTDAMVKRLGGLRWRRLHQAVYVIALLAVVHFFQQTKADQSLPIFMTGVFLWLMLYRIIAARIDRSELPASMLLALSVTVAALIFAGEAIGIGLYYRVSPMRVLSTAFDVDAIRPGWYVLGAGLAVVIADLAASWRRGSETRGRQPAEV